MANPHSQSVIFERCKADAERYKDRISRLQTLSEVIEYLERLEMQWRIYNAPDGADDNEDEEMDDAYVKALEFDKMDFSDVARYCAEALNISDKRFIKDLTPMELKELTNSQMIEVAMLFHHVKLIESVRNNPTIIQRIQNIWSLSMYAQRLMHCAQNVRTVAFDGIDHVLAKTEDYPRISGVPIPNLLSFTEEGKEKYSPYQSLLLYLLEKAHDLGYYKYNGDCYRQILTTNGRKTYAWKPVYTIKDFVYDMTRKEESPEQWMNLTQNKNNSTAAIEYLQNCKDIQFPSLTKDRYVMAFQNGLYFLKYNEFWSYGSNDLPPSGVIAACKYFDHPFPLNDQTNKADWYDIPTPNLQMILDFQEFDEEVCRWMYILLGRLLYEVGAKDSWQVIPFCKGQASSGKSTILLKIAKLFYDKSDVGVLSNNIEKKFGISAFHDKFLFVAPEIKADLQLEQAEFQSIVSGEDIQVNIKHQKAVSVTWTVPGILAGNEVPNWSDNSGSITRRVIVFDFIKSVSNGDMDLGSKLEKELPHLIKKCNTAYLEAVQKIGKDNIWVHLPKYFHTNRDELAANTNGMVNFLKSDRVVFGENKFVPLEEFRKAFVIYCNDNNLQRIRFNRDTYMYPLRSANVVVVTTAREGCMYKGLPVKGTVLEGVDLAQYEETNDF